MRVNAAGPLAGVGSGIAAVTAKGNTSRSTVPFPVPLASAPVPPRPGIAGDGTEWQDRPGVISVHSVNSVFALPSRLHGPPVSAMASVVPVSVSCVTAPKLRLFAPLGPVCQVSPLCLDQFQLELLNHPDRSVVNYVLSGIQHGFRIGFDTSAVTLKCASSNMRSAAEHPSVIDSYLQTEVSLGRVAGPFSAPPFPSLHISRFGVIPKSSQPGKWRLILDLSSPEGHSVNDGIPKPPFTVQYVSIDAFIAGILSHGRGTLLAKFDVASAYRNVGIHPVDRPLLGMKWREQYFVDLTLPFGLRSAPFIFTAIADLVEWILVHNYGVEFLRHYLDDFLTLGPPASPVCQNNLSTCVQLCERLGLPLHPGKLEGPATCLTILGIELDSVKLQARLPANKRERIIALLDDWSVRRCCRRQELESLIGHLHHACKVAPQGRTFLRRMINLLCAFRRDDHPIRLNQEFFRDLTWWRELFRTWDGLSFFCLPTWAPLPDFQVSSDAAGGLGYGAIWNSQWFYGVWSAAQSPLSIAYKELFPIVVAAALWGHQWVSRRVEFLCDNEAVVAVLKSGTSRDQQLMLLLRHLSLLAIRHSFAFTASSVPGKANPVADALSRFQFQRFRCLAPHADPAPCQVPASLLAALQTT